MTKPLDSYCNATFPLDIDLGDNRHARLLATDGQRVVGVIWYGAEFYIKDHGAYIWNGDGKWASDPTAGLIMHLPPPPGLVDAVCARYEAEIAEYQARLDANPDAPEAWRKSDEAVIAKLRRMIAHIRPEPKPLDQPLSG